VEKQVCAAHSGIDEKLEGIDYKLKSICDTLGAIDIKLDEKSERLACIGEESHTHRMWLYYLTGAFVCSAIRLFWFDKR
jgi:hypothetical protein